MRGLIKRTPECALHVHVAMPSAGRRRGRADGAARGAAADRRDRGGLAVLVRHGLGPGERALGGDPGLSRARRPAAAARLGRVPRDARRDPARRRARGPHDGVVGRAPPAAAGHRRAARAGRPDRARADGGYGGPGARAGAPGGRAAAGRAGAGPGAALVELPRRARRARRGAAVPRQAAPGARGGPRAAGRAAGRGRRARGRGADPREGGAPARQRAVFAETGMAGLLRSLADETARGCGPNECPRSRYTRKAGPTRIPWSWPRPLRAAPRRSRPWRGAAAPSPRAGGRARSTGRAGGRSRGGPWAPRGRGRSAA